MTSAEWHRIAMERMPGGVNSPVRSFKHVGGNPVFFQRGEGPYLFDVEGKRYIDFCLSFGPHLLGHSHPRVVAALKEQAELATSFGACHVKEVELAGLILGAFPYLHQVRLVNSGTEAVMTAIRLARGFSGKSKVIKFEGTYHGHSDALLAKAGSGVAELVCAAGLALPRTRQVAAWATAATFVAVFPGNVTMAVNAHEREAWFQVVAYARLPLQVPLVWWAVAVARSAGRRSARTASRPPRAAG